MNASTIAFSSADSGSAGTAQGPSWDLSAEYASFDAPQFKADFSKLETALSALEQSGTAIGARIPEAASLVAGNETALLQSCRQFALAMEAAEILLSNLGVFINCVASTDGANSEAKRLRGVFDSLSARLTAATAGFFLVMKLVPQDYFEAFCAYPDVAAFRFTLSQARKLKARALTLPVEQALSTMRPDGFVAWGNLYNNLTGTLRCAIKLPNGSAKEMGLAGAATLLKQPDRAVREAAWRAINQQMASNGEAFAAILNSLAGWRLAENKLRSHTEAVHYLDTALFQSRISRQTLDTLMAVLKEASQLGRKALRLQARAYGEERLGPWDILAPAPAQTGGDSAISFEDGLELVRRAYASVDPAMGAFVEGMMRQKRIEGRVMDGKRPGAFCTKYLKSRNPYVYMTYKGALSELSTLAHELGHAYHGEVLRAVSLAEADYPMTLAETASTFAETVLGDLLTREATNKAALFELAWADAQDAATFLVNIPARYEFERRFYEARLSGPLGVEALRRLMSEAWGEWYGDSLSGYDDYFWASKLHFSKSGVSFYNFPYSFGFLFSLGVFARKEQLGARFHESYVALLRDTGRLEAEELAQRHLGVDIRQPQFWQDSIAIVKGKLDRFEQLLNER